MKNCLLCWILPMLPNLQSKHSSQYFAPPESFRRGFYQV